MKAHLLILMLATSACGGSSGSYSCDQRSANMACLEFTGSSEFVAAYKTSCSSPGVWAETGCPKEQQLGGCRQGDSGNLFTTWFYAGGSYNSTNVQSACGATATFVSP